MFVTCPIAGCGRSMHENGITSHLAAHAKRGEFPPETPAAAAADQPSADATADAPSVAGDPTETASVAEPAAPEALPTDTTVTRFADEPEAVKPQPLAPTALTPEQRAGAAARKADILLRQACDAIEEMRRAHAPGSTTAAPMAIEAVNRARQIVTDFAGS